MRRISQRTLERYVEKWQQALRLQDWRIEVAFANVGELRKGTEGACEADEITKTAVILVIDPVSYKANGWNIERYDPEAVALHEMVHIHLEFAARFYPIGLKDKSFEIAVENAVESFTKSLIWLDRRKDGTGRSNKEAVA